MKFSYVSYATKAKLGINKKEDFVTEILLVIRMGLEPMTPTLKVLCSTS